MQELDKLIDIFRKNYGIGEEYSHMPAFEDFSYDQLLNFMKLAYNQALEDASETILLGKEGSELFYANQNKESILKLIIE